MKSIFFVLTIACTVTMADETKMPVIHQDIEFARAGDQSLTLDLYLPAVEGEAPLVVWIHGGGWRKGSKAKPPLRKLVDCGYAVASISYRFTDKAIFPAQIHDCKGAIRWLRANADKYSYDAERIGVAGSSAGGHLALLLGTSAGVAQLEGDIGGNPDQSSAVQAVVDYYGPSDFVLRSRTQPERALTTKSGSFALLGGLRDGKIDKQLQVLASPVTHASPDDPPMLIFHGDEDTTVLLDQSERMLEVLESKQKENENAIAKDAAPQLIVVTGAGHGGTKFFWGEHFDRARTFFDQHLRND